MWVYDAETEKIVHRPCTFVPGLYKIFDEIIVNAADNKQRDPNMNRIDVSIKSSENMIRVWNNGTGVPIAIHQEHKIYVPELIFGNLLTVRTLAQLNSFYSYDEHNQTTELYVG